MQYEPKAASSGFRRDASASRKPVIPAQRVESACRTSTAWAASMCRKYQRVIPIFAGGDVHPGRPLIADQAQTLQIVRRDRFFKPGNIVLFSKAVCLVEGLLAAVSAVGVYEEFDIRADRFTRHVNPVQIGHCDLARSSS